MLRSRLQPLPPQSDDDNTENGESPEDLFGGSLPTLFPDDAPSFHGDPGQRLIYASPRYGPLEIMIPSYPGQEPSGSGNVEEGRKLFAHLLWSAAMVVAEGVENADTDSEDDKDTSMWKVKGESVLELGAGAFLSSFPPFISFWTLTDLNCRSRPPIRHLLPRPSLHHNNNRPPLLPGPRQRHALQHNPQPPPNNIHQQTQHLHPPARMGNPNHRPLGSLQQGQIHPHHRRRLSLDALAAREPRAHNAVVPRAGRESVGCCGFPYGAGGCCGVF